MARVSKLQRHVAICRRGNILKAFLMKMGESSIMTKTLICRGIMKKQWSLGKVQKEPEENGKKEIDRVVWAFQRWTTCFVLPLSACSLYLSEETNKLKSLRIDGNPRKRTRVVICKQLFPTSSLPAAVQAKIFPPRINACDYAFASYVRREGP